MLTGGARRRHPGELAGGYYVEPTILEGTNDMRVFQEEIFGPVVSVRKFKDFDDAMRIANDSLYGLGAGVWSRDGLRARGGVRLWVGAQARSPFELSFREPKPGDVPEVGGVSVALEVADADAVHADLVAAGVPLVKPLCDNPWGDRSFVALDPNGLNLYLFHPIEAAPEFRSAVKT